MIVVVECFVISERALCHESSDTCLKPLVCDQTFYGGQPVVETRRWSLHLLRCCLTFRQCSVYILFLQARP